MSQQLYSQLVPAGQAAMVSAPGAVLTVKTVGGSATVALDGKGPTPVSGGTVLNGPFSTVNIFNGSAADWTITFFVGDAAVLFAPGDNSTNNAKSYLWGNLGIKTNAGANSTFVGAPSCDANGFLQITSNMYLLVSGTRNGARRQVLTLSVSPTAPVYLNVLDPNSGAFAINDPTPSEADIKVTRDLIRAGQLLKIEVLDHVILGRATADRSKDFSSLRELGYFYA